MNKIIYKGSLVSFNVGNFIKDTAKTATQRIVDKAISNLTSGLAASVQSVSNSVASSLLTVGSAFDSIQAVSSTKTDSIVQNGSSDYYVNSSKNPDKVSEGDVSRLRRGNDGDVNMYLNKINPSTKIEQSKLETATKSYVVV
jgi:hypothetical protein